MESRLNRLFFCSILSLFTAVSGFSEEKIHVYVLCQQGGKSFLDRKPCICSPIWYNLSAMLTFERVEKGASSDVPNRHDLSAPGSLIGGIAGSADSAKK
jgi:hypothetical protein